MCHGHSLTVSKANCPVLHLLNIRSYWANKLTSSCPAQVGQDAVVIEADAIKNRDVIYRSLEKMEHLDSSANLSQYVHEYSTRAAESMLVTAGGPPWALQSLL